MFLNSDGAGALGFSSVGGSLFFGSFGGGGTDSDVSQDAGGRDYPVGVGRGEGYFGPAYGLVACSLLLLEVLIAGLEHVVLFVGFLGWWWSFGAYV